MKRQLIALFTAAAMLLAPAASFAAAAADSLTTPSVTQVKVERDVTVIVNGREVYFADQQPIITEQGRTLVPARGVFEAMGAKVTWNGETQTARFDSENNVIRVLVKNNDPTMTVYKFTSLLHADETKVPLDVTPQVINDRTMVPLRAISESFGAAVDWDNETATVTITEPSYTENIAASDTETKKVSLTLSADKTEVKPGDEITLSVNAKGLSAFDVYLSGVTTGVYYDKTKFHFSGYTAMVGGVPMEGGIGAANEDYLGDSVKATHITTDTTNKAPDGVVMQLKFKALEATDAAEFSISNRYTTDRGYDTALTVRDSTKTRTLDPDECFIDTTPVSVKVAE